MTQLNKSRIKKMRNAPAEDICDFSSKLELTYTMDVLYSYIVDTPEFKQWETTAVAKLAKQGKKFELTATVKGVSITVRGRRI